VSKQILLTASASFAAIPGVAVMVTGIGTPPDLKLLFGGVIEAFGALSLLLIWLNRPRLAKVSIKRTTRWIVGFAITSFLAVLAYILLFGVCVVSSPTRGTVYFPLWTSGPLADMVVRSGSRPAAIEEYGLDGVKAEIALMPGIALPTTTAALLITYQGIFTPLALAFGLAVYHKHE
jgi:hypothetical protein